VTDVVDPRVVHASYGWWFLSYPVPSTAASIRRECGTRHGSSLEEICGSVPLREPSVGLRLSRELFELGQRRTDG